jgi:hypothetical protein
LKTRSPSSAWAGQYVAGGRLAAVERITRAIESNRSGIGAPVGALVVRCAPSGTLTFVATAPLLAQPTMTMVHTTALHWRRRITHSSSLVVAALYRVDVFWRSCLRWPDARAMFCRAQDLMCAARKTKNHERRREHD